MKKNAAKRLSLGICCMLVMIGLTGCGAGGSYRTTSMSDSAGASAENYAYSDDVYESAKEVAVEEGAEMSDASSGSEEADIIKQQEQGRKLIKNVSLSVETQEYDVIVPKIQDKVTKLGGYVENYYTNTGDELRYASITARIPAERLDEFITEVEASTNITYRNENVEDVTLQYVDLESHKKALESEQSRLLELMERAETIEEIIAIETRLTEVRYQLESMESQLRAMDNQITYSTVYLDISEVQVLTPNKEESAWTRITTGFQETLMEVGRDVADGCIWFLIHLPRIVLWLFILFIIFLIVRFVRRFAGKRKGEKKPKSSTLQSVSKDLGQSNPIGGNAGTMQDSAHCAGSETGDFSAADMAPLQNSTEVHTKNDPKGNASTGK